MLGVLGQRTAGGEQGPAHQIWKLSSPLSRSQAVLFGYERVCTQHSPGSTAPGFLTQGADSGVAVPGLHGRLSSRGLTVSSVVLRPTEMVVRLHGTPLRAGVGGEALKECTGYKMEKGIPSLLPQILFRRLHVSQQRTLLFLTAGGLGIHPPPGLGSVTCLSFCL